MTLTDLAVQPGAVAPAHPVALAELIVADGASADIAELLSGARAPQVLLGPCADALAELTAAIAQQKLDVLHIVAHGRTGGFSLGGEWIDTRTLAQHGDLLAGWKVSTIALWSCHAGEDDTLPQVLAALTGARVLATSGDLGMIGATARWELADCGGAALPAGFAAPFDAAVMRAWPYRLAKLSFVNAYAVNTATTPAGKEA
ncbi:MAG: DUF4347 domain-containing protein, partial [Gammaproteobacteria bacterium]